MHTGIGPAGGCQYNLFTQDLTQGIGKNPLYRSYFRLELPSAKVGAIIRN
jgi:hypothetical protein